MPSSGEQTLPISTEGEAIHSQCASLSIQAFNCLVNSAIYGALGGRLIRAGLQHETETMPDKLVAASLIIIGDGALRAARSQAFSCINYGLDRCLAKKQF